MRQIFVPVLLLATVALSSSNILPMLSTSQLEAETLGPDGQQNDNILSDTFNNIFYTVPVRTSQNNRMIRKVSNFINTNNDRTGERLNDIINKDVFDEKGFRQEQWHNYPRQLDRLHEYLFKHHNSAIEMNPDEPDNTDYNTHVSQQRRHGDISTNEHYIHMNDGVNNIYDAVFAATNPLLILKIHLACLNTGITNTLPVEYSEPLPFQTKLQKKSRDNFGEEMLFTNEINPAAKVKREEASFSDTENSGGNPSSERKMVNKRIFSLWSRLQSLSHKGHELPHRRHLHAYYGLPNGDAGGVLTAETRATLMRPPGSPLRWG